MIHPTHKDKPLPFPPGTRRHGTTTTMTMKSVCRRCNNGWMSSEIEGGAINPLKKLIVSENATLTTEDQIALTRWFVLKTMVLEHGMSTKDRVNSLDQCHKFYEDRSIPDVLQVWLFRCVDTKWSSVLTRHCTQIWSDEAPHLKGTYPNTHTVLMGIGDLLAFVFQSRSVNIDFGFDDRVACRVHPIGDDNIAWPPPAAISGRGAENLADALGGAIRASKIHES